MGPIRPIVVSLALAGTVGLAACASPSDSHRPRAGVSPNSSSRNEVAAIVQCFRANGAPGFPDPVYDPGDGRWHFAISPASVPARTMQACQHLFPPSTPSPPLPQGQFHALVVFAQCMRQAGVPDWPDPTPDGVFHIDARLWSLGKHGGVEQALQHCHVPSGGIDVVRGS